MRVRGASPFEQPGERALRRRGERAQQDADGVGVALGQVGASELLTGGSDGRTEKPKAQELETREKGSR